MNQNEKIKSVRAPQKLGGQASGLDDLVQMIEGKETNINVHTKTKLDWERHTKENELEDELEKNRKTGGYLGKQAFIAQATAVEVAKAKEIEKHENKLRLEAG